jgi:hypothetical protein
MIRGQASRKLPPEMLQTDEFTAPAWIAWWYRLFAPPPPQGRLATLQERERIRRGRLASIILAVQLFGVELPVIPVVQHAPNGPIVLPWLFGCITLLFCAFFFNRRGMLTIAGLLMVISIEVTMIVKIWTIPGGISVFYLPQFDVLIQPILIAVALLSPWSAFGVAAFNILFLVISLTVGPHASDLITALHTPSQAGDLFAVPIMTQILTAFFGFLIVSNLLETIKREDQAEQVALLEHTLAENRKEAEERSRQLEQGIAAIVTAIREVSAGQSHTRIQLPPGHVLFAFTTQLNHFLDRYQKARLADAQLMATTEAINELANEIYQANQQGRPPHLTRRNTPLDAVIVALYEITNNSKSKL